MHHKLTSIAIGAGVTLAGLLVTSGEFLSNTFSDHPSLGIVAIVSGGLLLVMILAVNTTVIRLTALLFPALLIVTAVFNLTEDDIGWELHRKPDNTLFALSEPSKEHRLYAYLQDNFSGWTLRTTPAALAASGLVEWELRDWGNLDAVQIDAHDLALNLTLTPDEIAHLLSRPHTAITYRAYNYLVFDPLSKAACPTRTLVLLHDGERSLLIPADVLPTQEGSPA